MDNPSEPRPDSSAEAPGRKASAPQVAAAIFWSFFGVRKNKKWQQDAASITPVQAIIGGLVGAAIFVFMLIFIVHLVTTK